MSWYDSSSLVIFPLKLVAIARALSDESFTGWRFEIALFSVESVVSPANILQEGRCGQASAGRRGELNEDLRSLAGC